MGEKVDTTDPIVELDNVLPNQIEPETFEDMLDMGGGNLAMGLMRAYIRPRNPEGTIHLMRMLGVDKLTAGAVEFKKIVYPDDEKQSNYFLQNLSLAALLNLAANRLTASEKAHFVGIVISFPLFLSAVTLAENAPIDVPIEFAVTTTALCTALHIYLVLGQRLNRARATLAINRAIKRGKKINMRQYNNRLGLRIPEKNKMIRNESS